LALPGSYPKGSAMPILTAASITKYKPHPTKRREIPDSKAQGLHLVIQPLPSGKKSFAIRLRRPDGRPAKMTLGPVDFSDKETIDDPVQGAPHTLGQARQRAAEIDRQRKRDVDVIEEEKVKKLRKQTATADREANSFAARVREFFTDYRTKRNIRPRRWRDDAGVLGLRYPPGSDPSITEPEIIKGGLAETWANKPVTEIDGYAVHTVVDGARKLGGSNRARKLHAALSVLFTWLQRQRRVTINPARSVWRPGPPRPRDRVLTDSEIVTLWKACGTVGGPFGALFKTLLLTGCRLREVSGMQHAELADGIWNIPGSRTKNHKPLSLSLPQLARDVIASVPKGSGLVFTTNGKTPVSGFSKVKRHLDAEMAKIAGKPITAWRVHDLRRTFASGLAALGIQLPVIERLLNHISGSFGGVQGIYQRYEFSDEMAEALQRWAVHIEVLVSDKPSNVAELAPRKKRKV